MNRINGLSQQTYDRPAYPVICDAAFFACQLHLNVSRCLLVADLVIVGQKEVWFEILFSRDQKQPETLTFHLNIAGFDRAHLDKHWRVHFGYYTCDVEPNASGTAIWSVPAAMVIDRKSRRIMRPIKLSLAPQRTV
jgi:hypothetical protein